MAFARDIFRPKNPQKYMGHNLREITYRSSWELSMFLELDSNPAVISWCSECITIPYLNPLKEGRNKSTLYVPDILAIYVDRNGVKHTDLIEIKPEKEIMGFKGKINRVTEARQIVNAAKWDAARKFCEKRNWTFRIMTENHLFQNGRPSRDQ